MYLMFFFGAFWGAGMSTGEGGGTKPKLKDQKPRIFVLGAH